MIDVVAQIPESIRRLSRGEYYALARAGAFEGERVELLGGFVIAMSPQNRRHALAIQQLTRWFVQRAPADIGVRPQLPLCLGPDDEPEPDLALTAVTFEGEHPSTAMLIVEVADSSLRRDRLKASLYAAAGVREYWIVNLEDDVVEVMRTPTSSGYAHREVVAADGAIEPECLPATSLAIAEILPAR